MNASLSKQMSKTAETNLVIPVVLCGGSGTRLWPLSRSGLPKQFLMLSGDGSNRSLFQQAIVRVNTIGNAQIDLGPTLIVTNEEHRFLALDQLLGLGKDIEATLILEPVGRNTAPALSLAALHALDQSKAEGSDPILVITPADQTVKDQIAFAKAVQDSVAVVAADRSKKTIVILGVRPAAPETGYGYIQRKRTKGKNNEFAVTKFVEKPDVKTAQAYLADGNYLWNSGIVVLRASSWLTALALYRSDIAKAAEVAWSTKTTDQSGDVTFIRTDIALFTAIPSESIDYSVLEKCTAIDNATYTFAIKTIELDAGWNDLGAWDAVWQAGKQDADGNVTFGDALLDNTKNSLVHASSRLVSTVGIENLIIIETADVVLVVDRKNSQDVKSIVKQLEKQRREEKNLHRKVYRPWGWYDSIDQGEHFKVKRIHVKPGASLSLQMHRHRAEHWIVVKGVAQITNGDQVITLIENQSTYIPQGETHRLANHGKETLEIIEVQSGNYLGEDDIVRFEDIYDRS
jgi:mannose-1-phosphate guanylyltransferase / mannose-6-phosphate isomerase